MPYIKLTTTKKLTHEQQQALSEGLTEAAKQIPGKEIIFLFIEDGKTVVKEIYVPGKIVNIVAK